MDDILLKSIIEKVEAQGNKIAEVQGTIKDFSGKPQEIEQVKAELKTMKSAVESISFPTKEMRELSKSMIEVRDRLNRPVTNTVQHHHHIPKIIWLCIGLFVSVAVVCTGWYTTANTLSEYKASDTKYRYLKLNSDKSLQQLLYITDSLYRVDKNLRDNVQQREETIREQFELQQRIIEKEREVSRLKEKMK